MIKRWFEPVLCFLVAIGAWWGYSVCGPMYMFSGIFFYIAIVAVILGLFLIKYWKIGILILIILWSAFLLPLVPLYIDTYWSYPRTIAIMPVIFTVLLFIIAIIASIRKPFSKTDVGEFKEKDAIVALIILGILLGFMHILTWSSPGIVGLPMVIAAIIYESLKAYKSKSNM